MIIFNLRKTLTKPDPSSVKRLDRWHMVGERERGTNHRGVTLSVRVGRLVPSGIGPSHLPHGVYLFQPHQDRWNEVSYIVWIIYVDGLK